MASIAAGKEKMELRVAGQDSRMTASIFLSPLSLSVLTPPISRVCFFWSLSFCLLASSRQQEGGRWPQAPPGMIPAQGPRGLSLAPSL